MVYLRLIIYIIVSSKFINCCSVTEVADKFQEYTNLLFTYLLLYYLGECFNHKFIENQEKRSADFVTEISNYIPNSDENLEELWYRIKSKNGDQMPAYPPGAYHCGTNYPIWINGKKGVLGK